MIPKAKVPFLLVMVNCIQDLEKFSSNLIKYLAEIFFNIFVSKISLNIKLFSARHRSIHCKDH